MRLHATISTKIIDALNIVLSGVHIMKSKSYCIVHPKVGKYWQMQCNSDLAIMTISSFVHYDN